MSEPHSATSRMDEEACAWADRLTSGLTQRERANLDRWIAQNPAHAWRLAHFRQFYAELHGTVPTLLATGRVTPPAPTRSRAGHRLRLASLGVCAAAIVLLAALVLLPHSESHATQTAEIQRIQLADGSRAELNAHTSLHVSMHRSSRHVRLDQGEAYFEVNKDVQRPFFVESAAGTVRVTGTKFNVRTDRDGTFEVTLLEGSVSVSTENHTEAAGHAHDYVLKPGDQLTIEGGLVTTQHLSVDDATDLTAWREGKLALHDTPLAVALARFGAFHGVQLSVSPEAAGLLLGGRYSLADLDTFLDAVERMLPVRVLRGSSGAIRVISTERSTHVR